MLTKHFLARGPSPASTYVLAIRAKIYMLIRYRKLPTRNHGCCCQFLKFIRMVVKIGLPAWVILVIGTRKGAVITLDFIAQVFWRRSVARLPGALEDAV